MLFFLPLLITFIFHHYFYNTGRTIASILELFYVQWMYSLKCQKSFDLVILLDARSDYSDIFLTKEGKET